MTWSPSQCRVEVDLPIEPTDLPLLAGLPRVTACSQLAWPIDRLTMMRNATKIPALVPDLGSIDQGNHQVEANTRDADILAANLAFPRQQPGRQEQDR